MVLDPKPAATPLGAAILIAVMAVFAPPCARAAEPTAFTIEAEDGYGIADCMQPGSACGQAMANAWCEAHGHARAAAFGSGDDITGVVPAAAATPTPLSAMVIRCAD